MMSTMLRLSAPLAFATLVATPAQAQQVTMQIGKWTLVTSPDRCELTLPDINHFQRIVRKKVDIGGGETAWLTTFVVLDNRYEPLAGMQKELPMAINGKVFDTAAFYVSAKTDGAPAGAGLTPIGEKDPTTQFKGKPVRITVSDGGKDIFDDTFDVPAQALPSWRACGR